MDHNSPVLRCIRMALTVDTTLSNTKIRFVGLIGVNRILESGLESGKLEKYDLGFLIFRKIEK